MTQPDPDEGTTMWLMLEFGLTIEEVACLWDAPGPWTDAALRGEGEGE